MADEINAERVKTYEHIKAVARNLNKMSMYLIKRGEVHDDSKLVDPEATAFANAGDLSSMEYESEDYKKSLESLGHALDHHYANNNHHPEHWGTPTPT